jgi:mono/diheme cytochrome c family protein
MRHPFAATLVSLAFVLAGFALSAPAQEVGNAKRGLALAQTSCAECHVIRAGAPGPSLANTAPSFVKLANTPGVNAMALYVALQTSHKQMPNLILPTNERDDVVAYILTLKRPK